MQLQRTILYIEQKEHMITAFKKLNNPMFSTNCSVYSALNKSTNKAPVKQNSNIQHNQNSENKHYERLEIF